MAQVHLTNTKAEHSKNWYFKQKVNQGKTKNTSVAKGDGKEACLSLPGFGVRTEVL